MICFKVDMRKKIVMSKVVLEKGINMFNKIKVVNLLFTLLIITCAGASFAAEIKEANPDIQVLTSHYDAVYKCGEDTVFNVIVKGVIIHIRSQIGVKSELYGYL